jgi:hypothetical protein
MTSDQPYRVPVLSERREFHRRRFTGTIEIEWGSSTWVNEVRDIGPRGMFVLMEQPLWIGATFSARLMVNPPLPMVCTVKRVEPGAGIAVVFDCTDAAHKKLLEEFLKKLPQA